MNIGMLVQKQYEVLDKFVSDFQKINMRIRTSKIPVVVATQGYVFGGGCEISMHCDAGIYTAESYIGLVESWCRSSTWWWGYKRICIKSIK